MVDSASSTSKTKLAEMTANMRLAYQATSKRTPTKFTNIDDRSHASEARRSHRSSTERRENKSITNAVAQRVSMTAETTFTAAAPSMSVVRMSGNISSCTMTNQTTTHTRAMMKNTLARMAARIELGASCGPAERLPMTA